MRVIKKMNTAWAWGLNRNPATVSIDDKNYIRRCIRKQPKFSSICYGNEHLDKFTREAAMSASQSVVSIVTFSDEKEIFQGSGTIIEENGTILTSSKLLTCSTTGNVVAEKLKVIVYLSDETSCEARLLAYDFYYGVAFVKIQHDVLQLKPASLRLVNDCVSLDSNYLPGPNSDACNIVPGDKVIALGRYFFKPYDIMAAPGQFSIKQCDRLECKELFRATCLITTTGVGGPIINQNGDVIGVISYDRRSFTPFLPLNIALKWFEHYNKSGNVPGRPLLGMKMANLYTTDLHVLDKLIQKHPNYSTGVIVEEVKKGFSSDTAGLCCNDLIVQCCGRAVRSFLELYDMLWDKTGESVDLVVIRENDDAPLCLSMEVCDAT